MYRDFSKKIARVAHTYAREREYWLNKLSGEPARSFFPYDNKHGTGQAGDKAPQKGKMAFKITGRLFSRLKEVSTGSDHTLHVILAAALTVLFGKSTGNRDIILEVPFYKQDDDMDMDFVNTVLALRNRIKPGGTFKELLLQVKDTLLAAHDHQNYPIEKLAEELALEFTGPGEDFPLFDVFLLLENIHDKRYIRHIHHNMTFSFLVKENLLEGNLEYNCSRYREATVKQIAGHFINLLEKVLYGLDNPLDCLYILSEQEKKEILVDFNDTETPYPRDKTIHELFEDQVEQTPDNTALEGQSTKRKASRAMRCALTYRELNEKSDRLAHLLIEKGVKPDTIVGIMVERSIELVVGILGILKAGGAYLPIDPDYPRARIDYMLNDSGAKILLKYNDITPETYNNRPKGTPIQPSTLLPFYPSSSSNLAYIIYTSGTTGNPKGVMLEHRGVVNYILWAARTYVKNETTGFPLYSSISFDLTVTSVFTPLLTGNTIYIYSGEEGEFLIKKILEDNRVEVVKLTPAHLKLIKEIGDGLASPPNSKLKRFIAGGENLETRLAGEIHEMWQGKIEIYNEYGPTETVVGSMIHRYDPGKDHRESVSIGVPIANTRVYLLDRDRNPVPAGVTGEIYIGGAGVGRGYLNNPELTCEKFNQDLWDYRDYHDEEKKAPFKRIHRSYQSYRSYIYKTGDMARRYADGVIEFLGRTDHQVKIRGFRVELSEIESRLKEFKKKKHTTSILEEPLVKAGDMKSIVRCSRCLLSANYPGIGFDSEGVCNVCREYEGYERHVVNYFKTPPELEQLLDKAKLPGSQYDCLLLFSGGKDSTYVLYRLVDMGLKVLTFTFDNGYISQSAFENIKRITTALKVDHIIGKAEHMNRVLVESLETNHTVCHGCWNALNAYGTKLADEKGINLVISGLSRGQIFEMRLYGLYQAGIFDEREIREKLLLFRKGFHSSDNKFSRILKIQIEEEVVEGIHFVDFFRYDDTKVEEIKKYLSGKGWVQPKDTGFCSSNCRINDIGIYMYFKERGIHFYEAPLSWDVRLGQITRQAGIEEIDFQPESREVDNVLREIGYYNAAVIKDVKVLVKTGKNGGKYLCGYIVADSELNARELRRYLAEKLPEYMIPSYFVQVEKIPLTASGKVDRKALLGLEADGQRLSSDARYVPPGDENAILMADLFKELLNLDQVGIEDNFFELGATSYEIIQVNQQLSKVFGREIPVIKLFEYPTIATFLEYLNGEGISEKEIKAEVKRDETMEKGKSRYEKRRKMRKI
jgi:amino acid adenylation domain-containing protein